MVAGLALVSGDRRLRFRVHAARRLLRPFLRPAEAQNQLGQVSAPTRAIGVHGILLQQGVKHARVMFGAALIPRGHEQGISDPPDPRVSCLALRAGHLVVGAADIVVQQRRQIVPVAAHRSRHFFQRHCKSAVCRREITVDVERHSEERIAPPLRCPTGAGYRDGGCVVTLQQVTNALSDDPVIAR